MFKVQFVGRLLSHRYIVLFAAPIIDDCSAISAFSAVMIRISHSAASLRGKLCRPPAKTIGYSFGVGTEIAAVAALLRNDMATTFSLVCLMHRC